jgi:hypothetical protein
VKLDPAVVMFWTVALLLCIATFYVLFSAMRSLV